MRLLRPDRAARRLGPGDGQTLDRLGRGASPDPRVGSRRRERRAGLAAKLGSQAEVARELAYRLYTICERKKRAAVALSYNGLVQSWPEIMRLANEDGRSRSVQPELFAASEGEVS